MTSHLEGGEEAAKAAGVEEVSHRVVELLRRRPGGRPPGADRLLTAPHVGEAPAHRSIPPLPRLAPSLPPSPPLPHLPNPPFVSGREANRRRSRFIFRKPENRVDIRVYFTIWGFKTRNGGGYASHTVIFVR